MRASCTTALLVLALSCSKHSASTRGMPPAVNICDVVAAPSKFAGQTISFRGRFSSDCYHGSSLNDFFCRFQGISAYTDQSMKKVKRDLLNNGMCAPYPRTPYSSDATALFTGVVIHVDRTKSPLLFQPEFELAITDFSDMRIVKKRLPVGPRPTD